MLLSMYALVMAGFVGFSCVWVPVSLFSRLREYLIFILNSAFYDNNFFYDTCIYLIIERGIFLN